MLEWDFEDTIFKPSNQFAIYEDYDFTEIPTWFDAPESIIDDIMFQPHFINKDHFWSREDFNRFRTQIRHADSTFKIKGRAHAALHYAIKKGNILRPSHCAYCEKDCKPEAHHEDYTQPLEVAWLCKQCHYDYHKGKLSILLLKSKLNIKGVTMNFKDMEEAYYLVKENKAKRIDVTDDVSVYRAGTIIRIDIKESANITEIA
jgi:hypothetical protein